MDQLELLRSLWVANGKSKKANVKRKTNLIVPRITYDGREGSLNNDSWIFNVTYAFREALDIKFEERKKNKKPYMVWTQGPFLSFKEGDMIHSKDGGRAVQVLSADKMSWNSTKSEMFEGRVVYMDYEVSGNSFAKLREHTCTQMKFLQLLIYGEYDSQESVKPTSV